MTRPSPALSRRRNARIVARIAGPAEVPFQTCTVPSCTKATALAAGRGLCADLCRYHLQYRARHGSALAPSYRATDLAPYLKAASRWIRANRADADVTGAIEALAAILDDAGPVEPAMNIKRRPAADRARIAFARLHKAGVKPERLLAIRIGMAALIQDDRDSVRNYEFRTVQIAKAAHRLASGTHRRWTIPLANGLMETVQLHVYPRSSGRVLRRIGGRIAVACAAVPDRAVEETRAMKLEASGPHPSHLPGWRPRWQREREKAMASAAEADRAEANAERFLRLLRGGW